MYNIDSDLRNADWSKRTWDYLSFEDLVNGYSPEKVIAKLNSLMANPSWEAAPEEFKQKAEEYLSSKDETKDVYSGSATAVRTTSLHSGESEEVIVIPRKKRRNLRKRRVIKHKSPEVEDVKSKVTRQVRTPDGSRKFGQPIGSVIVPDVIPNAVEQGLKDLVDSVKISAGRGNLYPSEVKPYMDNLENEMLSSNKYKVELLEGNDGYKSVIWDKDYINEMFNKTQGQLLETLINRGHGETEVKPIQLRLEFDVVFGEIWDRLMRQCQTKILIDNDPKYMETIVKPSLYSFEYVKNSKVCIATTGDALVKILKDGKFKTQFETGSSNGLYKPDRRRESELTSFFIPYELNENSVRPIYGYLSPSDSVTKNTIKVLNPMFETEGSDIDVSETIDVDIYPTSQYGNFKVVLKDSVKSRTTFTFGDSLGSSATPMSVSDSDITRYLMTSGINGHTHNDLDELFLTDAFYIESQIHNGVTIDDIESIEIDFKFSKTVYFQEVKMLAEKLGIRLNVVGEE